MIVVSHTQGIALENLSLDVQRSVFDTLAFKFDENLIVTSRHLNTPPKDFLVTGLALMLSDITDQTYFSGNALQVDLRNSGGFSLLNSPLITSTREAVFPSTVLLDETLTAQQPIFVHILSAPGVSPVKGLRVQFMGAWQP